jgi:hypothetical protein
MAAGKLLGMMQASHIRTLGTVPYVTQRLRSDSSAHNLQRRRQPAACRATEHECRSIFELLALFEYKALVGKSAALWEGMRTCPGHRSCPQNGEHPDNSRFGGTINELFVTTVTPMSVSLVESRFPKEEGTDG